MQTTSSDRQMAQCRLAENCRRLSRGCLPRNPLDASRHASCVITSPNDGRFVKVDEWALLAKIAARLAQPLSPAAKERRTMGPRIVPLVRAFDGGHDDALRDEPFAHSNGCA